MYRLLCSGQSTMMVSMDSFSLVHIQSYASAHKLDQGKGARAMAKAKATGKAMAAIIPIARAMGMARAMVTTYVPSLSEPAPRNQPPPASIDGSNWFRFPPGF